MLWLNNIRIGSETSVFGPVQNTVFKKGTKNGTTFIDNVSCQRRLKIESLPSEVDVKMISLNGEIPISEGDFPETYGSTSVLLGNYQLRNYDCTLNPYLTYVGSVDDTKNHLVLCYLSIDMEKFMPIFYVEDTNVKIRETYLRSYNKSRGMLFMLEPDANGKIYGGVVLTGFVPGSDEQLQHVKISLDLNVDNDGNASIETSIEELKMSPTTKKNMKARYAGGKYPCSFKISADGLFTKFYCGTMIESQARSIIDDYLKQFNLKNYNYTYCKIPNFTAIKDMDKCADQLIKVLNPLSKNKNMRAIILVGNKGAIRMQERLKLKLHYILRVDQQRNIRTIHSN